MWFTLIQKMEKLPDLGVCTPVSNKPTCPIISWGYSAELKSPKENAGKPYVWWYKLQDIWRFARQKHTKTNPYQVIGYGEHLDVGGASQRLLVARKQLNDPWISLLTTETPTNPTLCSHRTKPNLDGFTRMFPPSKPTSWTDHQNYSRTISWHGTRSTTCLSLSEIMPHCPIPDFSNVQHAVEEVVPESSPQCFPPWPSLLPPSPSIPLSLALSPSLALALALALSLSLSLSIANARFNECLFDLQFRDTIDFWLCQPFFSTSKNLLEDSFGMATTLLTASLW